MDFNNLQSGTLFFCKHLPGNNVGVMFHARDNDNIAGLDVCSSPRLGHQVNGVRRSCGPNYFFCECRVEMPPNGFACLFKRIRRLLR